MFELLPWHELQGCLKQTASGFSISSVSCLSKGSSLSVKKDPNFYGCNNYILCYDDSIAQPYYVSPPPSQTGERHIAFGSVVVWVIPCKLDSLHYLEFYFHI